MVYIFPLVEMPSSSERILNKFRCDLQSLKSYSHILDSGNSSQQIRHHHLKSNEMEYDKENQKREVSLFLFFFLAGCCPTLKRVTLHLHCFDFFLKKRAQTVTPLAKPHPYSALFMYCASVRHACHVLWNLGWSNADLRCLLSPHFPNVKKIGLTQLHQPTP